MSFLQINRKIQSGRFRRRLILFPLLFGGMFIAFGLVITNIGYLFLNHATAQSPNLTASKTAERSLEIAQAVSLYKRPARVGLITLAVQNNLPDQINQRLTQLEPTASEYLYWGDVAVQSQQFAAGNQWFQTAVESDPQNPAGWAKLSQSHQALAQFAKAELAAEQAWNLDQIEYARLYVSALLEVGKTERATAVLTQTLDQSQNHRDRFWMWEQYGRLLTLAEQWDIADNAYRQAVSEYPNSPTFYIRLGEVALARGDAPEVALGLFEAAVQTENPAPAYFAIGQHHARAKDFAEAELWLAKAVSNDPSNRSWYRFRGTTAMRAKNYPLAEAVWQEMLTQFPQDSTALFELATAYFEQNKLDLAHLTVDAALASDGEITSRQFERAGQIYEAVGAAEKAIEMYTALLKMEPDNKIGIVGLERLKEQ